MAIIDPLLVMKMPRKLTAAGGIDAVTHALESYVSVCATPFTQGHAREALRLLFKYLPRAYVKGEGDPEAREQVHYASTIAGMSFANAFLGICHSMAHKLGARFHVPHGLANAGGPPAFSPLSPLPSLFSPRSSPLSPFPSSPSALAKTRCISATMIESTRFKSHLVAIHGGGG
jgi:hypothetical protein